MPDPTGRFVVRTAGGEISIHPSLTRAEFEAHPAAGIVRWTHHPGSTVARLPRVEILGRCCTFEVRFEPHVLARASIFIHLDADGSSWDDWTLEQEMARKRAHDALAQDLFGTPLTPRPIQLDAKSISPLFPDEQWPRWAEFPWGRIVSSYDSKGGFSQLWVDLDPPAPGHAPPRT